MIDILATLKKARALIADPEHWTKEVSARDREGRECSLSEGYSFCAIGAIDRALQGVVLHADDDFPHDALRNVINSTSIAHWNDRSTHADVLAGFDRAIALASQ